MAPSIDTNIHINSPVETVWHVLTEFSAYPEWNDFICLIEGEASLGERLKTSIAFPSEKPITFKPTIVTCDTEKELAWVGRLILPTIFEGHHRFRLIALDENTTVFRQSERFSGLIAPFLFNRIKAKTERGFHRMNEALKKRCED